MSIQKQCSHCGTSFEGRSNRLYCSDGCKQRAFQHNQQASSSPEPDSGRKQPVNASGRAISVKAEVEIARLGFANGERLKALEAEERQRERQHELTQQERAFKMERQRADSTQAAKQGWVQERDELLHRLAGLESRLPAETIPAQEPEPDTETDSAGLSPLLWVVGGALLWGLMKREQPTPVPPTKTLLSTLRHP